LLKIAYNIHIRIEKKGKKMEQNDSLQVLKSAAGYYLGTLYYDKEMEGWFPNSRDTCYLTKEEATGLLARWEEYSSKQILDTIKSLNSDLKGVNKCYGMEK
jgi:hypothetical protein